MAARLSNWGNHPKNLCVLVEPENEAKLKEHMLNKRRCIARGMGRCYGDSSLGDYVLSTKRLNEIESFGEESGELVCQSGVSLEQILKTVIPKKFFLPVTPGTKFVSVGGAIAANIHGKNHHKEGCFADHVLWFELLLSSGELIRCSESENGDLFSNTVGGMGLTGVIVRACIKLKPIETSYINKETHICNNLTELMTAFERTENSTYSVAWIDCFASDENMGRGVLYTGEHATMNELSPRQKNQALKVYSSNKLNIPFFFPTWFLTKAFLSRFNAAYFRRQKNARSKQVVPYEGFFYPLDAIRNWNRVYGKKGFVQYQVVLPFAKSKEGLEEMLRVITNGAYGSFLAVLKLFGESTEGLSFPMRGYTLALDFPVNEGVMSMLEELDQLVLKHGGRGYLAKDARMSKQSFDSMYPDRNDWVDGRSKADPDNHISSHQGERLGIS
jgi:decaprenylphospho-beta-D-ribofuranose 2-oxidase